MTREIILHAENCRVVNISPFPCENPHPLPSISCVLITVDAQDSKMRCYLRPTMYFNEYHLEIRKAWIAQCSAWIWTLSSLSQWRPAEVLYVSEKEQKAPFSKFCPCRSHILFLTGACTSQREVIGSAQCSMSLNNRWLLHQCDSQLTHNNMYWSWSI